MSKRKALFFLFSLVAWLAIVINAVIINRYAYHPSGLVIYAGGLLAAIGFFLTARMYARHLKKVKSKDYFDYLFLILIPPGVAFVAFYSAYAAGSTLTQLAGGIQQHEYFIVTVTDKKIDDYVPAGGCRYKIDMYIDHSKTEIINHCLDNHLFRQLNTNTKYPS